MRILILEDDENRVRKFKENFIGCELFITHLTDQAIEWIQEEEFNTIFLDHDLAEEHYMTWQNPTVKHEKTGLEVAEFLGNNLEFNKSAQIIIHSLNPYGRENMRQACGIRNAEIVPFTVLFDRLIIR